MPYISIAQILIVLLIIVALWIHRPSRKLAADWFQRNLWAWVLPFLWISLNLEPWNWLKDASLFAAWGGVVSLFGVMLSFVAQARVDDDGGKLSHDLYYKCGLFFVGIGTILWALGDRLVRTGLDLYRLLTGT